MWKFPSAVRRPGVAMLIAGAALALAAQAAIPGMASAAPAPPRGMHAEVAPRATGELDCNGLSPIQHAVKDNLACADPKGSIGGRFYENGHYIGHDDS